MKARSWRWLALASAVLATPAQPQVKDAAPRPAAATRPNIVFILTDDQRYDELGFLNPEIRTPVLDRMARDGVHMKNAFVTTALCSPSRATLLTGQHMHDHGVVDNNAGFAPGSVMFPQLL